LAGIQSVAAVQRDASDQTAFRLALVENMHREDLSHQEKVEALDMLASMAAGKGLWQVAGELGTSPGWLSRRLSMRQDPVIFPALEEGRITFVQANELLSAPTTARQKLLDGVIGTKRRVSFDELRTWSRLPETSPATSGTVRQRSRRLSRRISLTAIFSCRRLPPMRECCRWFRNSLSRLQLRKSQRSAPASRSAGSVSGRGAGGAGPGKQQLVDQETGKPL